MKKIIIGCGTGRCGTVSLSKLLSGCTGVKVSHEMNPVLPWIVDENMLRDRMRFWESDVCQTVGDVAYYYLPYLEKIMKHFDDVKIVCMWRSRKEVVDSFMWKTQNLNSWADHDGTVWGISTKWDITFPKYPVALESKRKAVVQYWDEYYEKINELKKKYPDNIKIFRIDALNTEAGQKKIFDFCGIPEGKHKYKVQCRFNQGRRI